MRRPAWLVAATAAAAALALTIGVSALAQPGADADQLHTRRVATRVPNGHQGYSLDGLNETVVYLTTVQANNERAFYAAVQAQQARAAAAARQRQQRSTTRSYSGGAVSGSCAAMKPAGFPDYIINRESGGDPNARNPNGGAYGCAQIMPEHFASGGGCQGKSYADCWNYLWAGGRGASNWACTPESGCG